MDKATIMTRIPHRGHMLLLDEAVILDDKTVEGKYHVRGDEFFLQGHFPGHPVVPGVMLCEMMAQTSGVLFGFDIDKVVTYFTGIRTVTFKRPVRPGDTVVLHCVLKRQMGHFYFATGTGTVDGEVCVQGDFSFAVLDKDAEDA